MNQQKYLFIDRDGTLVEEPQDKQVDSLDKIKLMNNVIPALLTLQKSGYQLVMVSNQDGLGTAQFTQEKFSQAHEFILSLLATQSIYFHKVHICPHFAQDKCTCRKPNIGLVLDYLKAQTIDKENSYVIGDRQTDLEFAKNIGLKGILIDNKTMPWDKIVNQILWAPKVATIKRNTQETQITVAVNLSNAKVGQIQTGIGFFDHMLAQLAYHGGFGLEAKVLGDLEVDDHHTVEDTAIALGQALLKALNDKRGITRYGFVLPMDESLAEVALDLCGRFYFAFSGVFQREKIGSLSTELVSHFFRTLAQNLGATLHIKVQGENTHHMVEAIFKAVGRCIRQALQQIDDRIPSTKGCL